MNPQKRSSNEHQTYDVFLIKKHFTFGNAIMLCLWVKLLVVLISGISTTVSLL